VNIECPSCHRPVAARRRAACVYCGAAIPEELRFTPEESAAVEAELKELERRRAEFKAKEEEERREAQRRDGGIDGTGPMFGG
jgi:hypothetical protein